MGRNKKTKAKKVEKVDYNSPASKRMLTMWSNDTGRRTLSIMLAINEESNSRIGTPAQGTDLSPFIQSKVAELYAEEGPPKYHNFWLGKKEAERLAKGPTGLSAEEWREVTSTPMLKSVKDQNPHPRVGELIHRKGTQHDRAEFFKLVANMEKRY